MTFELGSDSVKDEKRINYKYDLQAIGKDVWRVGPKRRGIIKMYAALFLIFPPEFTNEDVVVRIEKRKLLQAASLLSWYAQVIQAETSFVQTLYRNAGWGHMI